MSIGAVLWFDSRYAQASELHELREEQESAFIAARVKDIEDSLFDIEAKSRENWTDLDRAKMARFKRELETLRK